MIDTTETLLSATLGLDSPEATAQLAVRIGQDLRAGDVVLLGGPIGAGKTHFCRALIQSLLSHHGACEDVPSPTFTLVQVYDAGGTPIWHADLYRLSSPDEVIELGLDEAFEDAICLVEWPDRLGPLRPRGALDITLAPSQSGETRRATLASDNPRWAALLAALRTEGPAP